MTRIAFFAVYLAVILQVTFATPLASKRDVVVHERFPAAIPSGWLANQRLHPEHVLNVQIALKQQNIDKLYDTLIDVSHPASVNYGKHWTVQKMAEHFEPSLETKRAVIDWLTSEGIARRRIAFSGSHGFIHFNASASELEKLLHTRYYRWTHADLQLSQAGVHPDDNYSVPASVKPHIDYITPTVHIDPWGVASRISQKQARLVRRRVQAQVQAALLKRDATPDNTTASNNITKPIIVHQPLAAPPSNSSLTKCGSNITPTCLRAMYNIPQLPTSIAPTKQNALGVVEYPYDSFVQADLNTFFARYSTHQVQKAPNFVSVDGGTTPYQNFTGDENTLPSYWDTVESNLDLQYTMALVNPIPVTLFQAGDLYQGASFANFLQSLDASFCQYEDPNYDGNYREYIFVFALY
jgi:tripeptidyl-peptidase-1